MTRAAFLRTTSALALASALLFGGHARASAPTLDIYNMTKISASVTVHRAGAFYGKYTIEPFGKVAIYGDGAFTFNGSVGTAIVLTRKDTTLVAGARTRGLIIEVKGTTTDWTFGQTASGAVI